MYEVAGMLGVDPNPLTLRELLWMLKGRNKIQWQHTSELLAMIHNAHFTERITAQEINPYAEHREQPRIMVKDFSFFKQFCVSPEQSKVNNG